MLIVGRSGGLVLYWKALVNLTVEDSDRYYIDAVIDSGGMRWSCPPSELVKINFDGVVFGASNMFGIGVVIRDSNGDVLTSCSQKIPQAYKVEEIEALAAFKALSFAFVLGFSSAILEGDSLG